MAWTHVAEVTAAIVTSQNAARRGQYVALGKAEGDRNVTDVSKPDRHSVLGLGGVFVRARDPEALAAWYREHLGLDVHDFGGAFGAIFNFVEDEPGYQIWTAFPANTPSFGNNNQPQILNFRVADLDGLLAQLRADGVAVDEEA